MLNPQFINLKKTLFSLCLLLTFTSVSAFSAENSKVTQALDFVMSHHNAVFSELFKKDEHVFNVGLRTSACQDKEETKRLLGVMVNNEKAYVDRLVKIYSQASSDTVEPLPKALIRDISYFYYRSYVQGYLRGYWYRAKVYMHFHPEIKQDFCDKAGIDASALLDQIINKNSSVFSHDYVAKLKLFRESRVLKANARFGRAAFQKVFNQHANYFDAYVYALLLNKKEQGYTLYQYIMGNDLKKEFYKSLASLVKDKSYHFRRNDNHSFLVNDAYSLRFQGYVLGFVKFFQEMKKEYPELNEAMATHMPEYLAKNIEKLANSQPKKTSVE